MINYLKQLPILDASIEKWRKVVFNKEITIKCPLCECHNPDCNGCVINFFTGENFCYKTSYYQTNVHETKLWLPEKAYYNTTKAKADNAMLSELYEIRRQYIAYFHKRRSNEDK